jgi:hypothetical protein
MATKRMFSLKIVDTDAFTDMPNDAQLLYFRLCMAADDDGFVASPRRVMRCYGFGEDSMKLLISKKFTLVMKHNDTAILLIKHWKMHNTIQKDRYTESPYHGLLREVFLDENNAYSLTPGDGKRPALPGSYPDRIQIGSTGKNSLDKSSTDQFSEGDIRIEDADDAADAADAEWKERVRASMERLGYKMGGGAR